MSRAMKVRPPSNPPTMTPVEFFLLDFGVTLVVEGAFVGVTTTVSPPVTVLHAGEGFVVS